MSWLSNLFGSKSSTKEKDDLEPSLKEYEFLTSEAHCIGDWYRYKIKATSKKEAFKKLFIYFHGLRSENIDSESGQVVYPSRSVVNHNGMPRWFFDSISGNKLSKSQVKEIISYAKKNNIKLKEEWL